jgi:hypothetical protein
MSNQDSNNEVNNEQTLVIIEPGTLPANLDKPLDIPDTVVDRPLKSQTADEIAQWCAKENEKTRSNITTILLVVFGLTMAGTFILTGIAAFNKDVDKSIIQSQTALAINATTALLCSAMGYYFGTQKNK